MFCKPSRLMTIIINLSLATTNALPEDELPETKGSRSVVLKDQRETVPQSLREGFSTSALSEMPTGGWSNGHICSATEPHASTLEKSSNWLTESVEETDEDLRYKLQRVRKKSGELVRPALRGHRRPSSMSGTPIFSKSVHFDSHLAHVRHFLQLDRPLAVSAVSSSAEPYDSNAEYPFPRDERANKNAPPFESEPVTPNPHNTLLRKAMPVRLERFWLSHDHKSLLGSIAVANLAFQKSVVCRFTLDYWKTVSEVSAKHSCREIGPRESPEGHDRFTFTIELSDLLDLKSKTLFFCVRYLVNGQEYWDNNNSTNFQVNFKEKHLPQNVMNEKLPSSL